MKRSVSSGRRLVWCKNNNHHITRVTFKGVRVRAISMQHGQVSRGRWGEKKTMESFIVQKSTVKEANKSQITLHSGMVWEELPGPVWPDEISSSRCKTDFVFPRLFVLWWWRDRSGRSIEIFLYIIYWVTLFDTAVYTARRRSCNVTFSSLFVTTNSVLTGIVLKLETKETREEKKTEEKNQFQSEKNPAHLVLFVASCGSRRNKTSFTWMLRRPHGK